MLFIILLWLFASLSVHWAANYSGAANESYVPGFLITTFLFIICYVLLKKIAASSNDVSIIILSVLVFIGIYVYICYKALRVPIEGVGYFISSFLFCLVSSILLALLISRSFAK